MSGFESGFFVPDVSLAVAFLAGLFSFASPCVFPLIPLIYRMSRGFRLRNFRAGKGRRTTKEGGKRQGGTLLSTRFFYIRIYRNFCAFRNVQRGGGRFYKIRVSNADKRYSGCSHWFIYRGNFKQS